MRVTLETTINVDIDDDFLLESWEEADMTDPCEQRQDAMDCAIATLQEKLSEGREDAAVVVRFEATAIRGEGDSALPVED